MPEPFVAAEPVPSIPVVPEPPAAPEPPVAVETPVPEPSPVVEPVAPVESVTEPPVAEPDPVEPTPEHDPTPTAPAVTTLAAAPFHTVVDRIRTDNDVRTGHFCDVVSGEHAGRYGVYTNTVSLAPDGYPDEVVVRTRDALDENLLLKYSDLRPAEAGRR